jgi:D-alanyl-lipoteichoic acid acyltransferase DltB (MBOAT superfamily)
MLFPTMAFAIFFLIVYFVAWSLERENFRRKVFLLGASWVFYGWWDWRFVGLLIFSALFNWFVADRLHQTRSTLKRKWLIALVVLVNLTILGFFKYYDFFLAQLGEALKLAGWERDLPLMQIILPVGVSFFTFQAISYVVDVHRGVCKPARSVLDVMLMMSFFPHLVAGPIVRARDLLPQFDRTPKLTREMATHGILLIVWGLFKKTVIASELAAGIVDPVFFDPKSFGALDLLGATYGYAVQIYCDFSAYSDMAIGLAALLGYRFPRNFDQPYRASSLQDFWRRWHMSLSSWLRDYLYIPLGGSRGGMLKACRNLMITMLLGGLWHGASWTFVAWGALHGGVLCLERLWKAAGRAVLPTVFGVIVTFHIVCLSWILFRSEDFPQALDFVVGLLRWNMPMTMVTPFLLFMITLGLAIHALPPRLIEAVSVRAQRIPSLAFGVIVALLMLVIEAMRPEGIAPFIYYQF